MEPSGLLTAEATLDSASFAFPKNGVQFGTSISIEEFTISISHL